MTATPVATPGDIVVYDPTSLLIDRRRFLMLAAAAGAVASGSVLLPSRVGGVGSASLGVAATGESVLDSIVEAAAELDHDVERIFRFVSEEIRYEPYVGILRGANGTLRGRAGNSADQALLLAEMLKAGGTPLRFATGRIDDETAVRILRGAVTDVATARDDAFRVLVADAQATAALVVPSASPDPDQDTIIANAETDGKAIIATATRQVHDGVGTIMDALTSAGITLPAASATLPDRERSQHVWIQVSAEAGWVDLDPTLISNLMGDSLASADTTPDVLPDDLRHRVQFAAMAESWVSGRLIETPVMEYATYADEVQGVSIAFTNVRSDDLGINIVGDIGGSSAQYTTVLEVGPKVFVGEVPLVVGGPGAGFFGESTDTDPVGLLEGEASAEWLEVRTFSPDAEPQVARRAIFDRIGQATRESGQVDPLGIASVQLVESGQAFGEYPPLMAVHAFAVVGGPVSGLQMLDPLPKRSLGIYSWMALAYHYMRDGMAAEIGLAEGVRMVVDRPGVVSFSLDYAAGAAVEMSVALDIWHRSFTTLPVADRPASVHPAVLAGVLSHIAERVATGDVVQEGSDIGRSVSVGAIFDLARAQDIPVRVIQEGLPATHSWPPEALTFISAAVAAGWVVIVPERAIEIAGRPRLGWWLVDPVTGRTDDQMDDGRGQNTVEYQVSGMRAWVRVLACSVFWADVIFGAAALLATALGKNQAGLAAGGGVLLATVFNRKSKVFELICNL